MTPDGETEYRLCVRPEHYRSCYSLDQRLGLERVKLSFPTVRALRGGTVIGFLSTQASKDAVIARRMTLDPVVGRLGQGILAMRLAEAYEEVLRKAGVTRYLVVVDKRNGQLLGTIEKVFGAKPYAETEEDFWFRKEVA